MMRHGVAWLGLVTGAKLWHLAHPSAPKPSDRECSAGGRIDYELAQSEGVTHCLLRPGETIFVPEQWWHATCNLDPYTIGVGGQLWRPKMEGRFETSAERKAPLVDVPPYDADALTTDLPLPDRIEPIIFEPDAPEEEEDGVEAVEVSPAAEAKRW